MSLGGEGKVLSLKLGRSYYMIKSQRKIYIIYHDKKNKVFTISWHIILEDINYRTIRFVH